MMEVSPTMEPTERSNPPMMMTMVCAERDETDHGDGLADIQQVDRQEEDVRFLQANHGDKDAQRHQ